MVCARKTRAPTRSCCALVSAGGSGIVYCLSRKRVEEISRTAAVSDGIAARPYHAGLDAEARRDNQEAFIRDDAQVMVATDRLRHGDQQARRTVGGALRSAAHAGGLLPGVRARRTRWRPGALHAVFGAADIRTADFLIQQKVDPDSGEPLEEEQRIARQQLRQVLSYAESTECRRAIQLRYLGEDYTRPLRRLRQLL